MIMVTDIQCTVSVCSLVIETLRLYRLRQTVCGSIRAVSFAFELHAPCLISDYICNT